jgi:activator of 2-hydroxyglutaryl-CoA dehydratase
VHRVCGKRSHLAHGQGEKPANIALGLHLAIVQRTLAMLRRVGVVEPALFAGGVAHNPCVRSLLEEYLDLPVIVPDQPDLMGALGAALYGGRSRQPTRAETVAIS